MAVRIRSRRYFECDTEAERSLEWPIDTLIYCIDTNKYFKIFAGDYVEIPEDEVIFVSPITMDKIAISGVPDGFKFLRDDGSWAEVPLGDNLFKGYFFSEAALTGAYPTSSQGTWAIVDNGVTEDASIYIWDDTDSIWVQASGGGGGHIIWDSADNPLAQEPVLQFKRLNVTAETGKTVVTRPADTFTGIAPPSNPVEGDVWTDTNDTIWKTYVRYDGYWVERHPESGGTGVPPEYYEYMLYFTIRNHFNVTE